MSFSTSRADDWADQLGPHRCFSVEQREKIAQTIVDLEKCQVDLKNKNQLIEDRLTKFDGAESLHWWQDPFFVWGGISISFSVGAIVGFLAVKDK